MAKSFNQPMSDQEREAHRRQIADMPAEERAALLAALEDAQGVNGQIDLMAVTQGALRRLGLSPAEIKQRLAAAIADPLDWRSKLT